MSPRPKDSLFSFLQAIRFTSLQSHRKPPGKFRKNLNSGTHNRSQIILDFTSHLCSPKLCKSVDEWVVKNLPHRIVFQRVYRCLLLVQTPIWYTTSTPGFQRTQVQNVLTLNSRCRNKMHLDYKPVETSCWCRFIRDLAGPTHGVCPTPHRARGSVSEQIYLIKPWN